MKWWHKIPKWAKTTVKIEECFSYPQQDATSIENCGFSVGDRVQHNGADTQSNRYGWQGRVTQIRMKAYKDNTLQVQLLVTYGNGTLQWYFINWFSRYLINLTKQEKEMSSGNFIVWCPFGGNPSARHQTEKEAEQEASRLAKLNPDKQFYVCQLKSVSEVASVVTRRL